MLPAVPRDLRRERPDRGLRLLAGVASAYLRLARGPGNPVAVDRTLRLAVTELHTVAEDVVALRLAAPDGRPLPTWQPGSHIDLVLPSGRMRQYSLTGAPDDRRSYRVAVRRVPGGAGSAEVHGLAVGQVLAAFGPRNAFPFVPLPRTLFVAGGIGITPIAPMVRAAARRGVDWRLVYTGRSRASMPFLDALGDPARITVRPDDELGAPTAEDLLAHAPAGGAVYACGPPPMLDGLRAGFRAAGAAALHTERFSPPPVVGGRPLQVVLARSGAVLDVPADRTVLDVVRETRPDVAYSCRQGFCGTCRVRVPGGDSVLICTDRAAGDRLVLDL